jgi:aspartate aminotransferase
MATSAEQWLWQSRIAPELLEVATPGEIDLSTGSPRFDVPLLVRDAITREVKETDYLPYPPTAGAADLQEGVASYLRRYQGLGSFTAGQILVSYGAMQALYDIIAAVTGPGDEVLVPAPYWFQYPHIVRNCGATPKLIATFPGNNFKLTPKLLAASITPASKLLIFTSPNNPSGTVYGREDLAELARVIADSPGLLVISNGVYDLLLLERADGGELPVAPTLASFPEIAKRVFVVNSLSKNYAMSGLRVGYAAIADAGWLARMTQRQRFSSLGVNVYLQAGALAAITATKEIAGHIVRTLHVRLPKALELLRTVPRLTFIPPQAGYYVWVDVKGYFNCRTPEGKVIRDDTDLALYLRQEMPGRPGVAVVDGTSCGTPGYFRITFAVDEDTFRKGVEEMKLRLAALRCG